MFSRIVSFGFFAALAATASALTLNQPDHPWVIGTSQTVTWESTATDPATFALLLNNQEIGQIVPLSPNVITSVRSFTLVVPDVEASDDWRLEAAATTNPGSPIYSYTAPFDIEA